MAGRRVKEEKEKRSQGGVVERGEEKRIGKREIKNLKDGGGRA